MKSTVNISIIIPTRKGNDTTKVTESIKKHTKGSYEIIIEDEGGFAEAINIGAKRAQGDYIILLHDDNVVTEGWADELAEVGCFNVRESSGSNWGGFYPGGYCTDQELNPDYAMFLCLSKEAAKKILPFDENFKNPWCQDVDMGFRIKEKGFKIKCLPGKIIHNWAGGEHTGTNEQYLIEKWGI